MKVDNKLQWSQLPTMQSTDGSLAAWGCRVSVLLRDGDATRLAIGRDKSGGTGRRVGTDPFHRDR